MHENRETSETPAAKPGNRSEGEGDSRTARVYVSEESHRGIVPMNQSNKDGPSSAEIEEGRLRLKENTLSFDTYPTQRGTARVPRWASVRTSDKLDRYSSERRTGCANERPSGSVRGALGNRCPYRDHQPRGNIWASSAVCSTKPRSVTRSDCETYETQPWP